MLKNNQFEVLKILNLFYHISLPFYTRTASVIFKLIFKKTKKIREKEKKLLDKYGRTAVKTLTKICGAETRSFRYRFEEVMIMDLEFTISAQESSSTLQVEITDNRAIITGLASGRKIVFEGAFGDVIVKLQPVQGSAQSVPELPSVEVQAGSQEVLPTQPAAHEIKTDQQLFWRLKALRKEISAESKVPPFVIFHDNTLREMCRRLPANLEALKNIPGVGEAKLAKFGSRFLEAIRQHVTAPGKVG